MSKQVKTPRFYVDIPTFLHATGQLGWDDTRGGAELLYMNPPNPYLDLLDSTVWTPFQIGSVNNNTPKTSFPINFCALLNHNVATDTNSFGVIAKAGLNDYEYGASLHHPDFNPVNNVINFDGTEGVNPSFNGTTIWTFKETDHYWRSFEFFYPYGKDDYTHQLGSLVVGKYWDAPNSPDLNLTMSRRFDGISTQKTIGGKTFSNIHYDGPIEWIMNGFEDVDVDGTITTNQINYKYPPFELDIPNLILDDPSTDDVDEFKIAFNQRAKSGLGRKGLRTWKLSFSYISDDDMWMSYESSSNAPFINEDLNSETGSTPPTDSDVYVSTYPNPMLSDDSFNFVWNCTLGGALPFIFQPDNENNNPDQFSICTFRENSLDVKQVAFNTYSVSVTIDEIC